MKIVHAKNYDEMSQKAAAEFISLIAEKPDALLGLATGSSPVGMYQCMIEAYKAGKISFKNIRSFNLDEYYPITPDNDQSYRYFMDTNLFNAVDIDKNNTRVPDGQTKDPDGFGAKYDEAIAAEGGIDLQILGVGPNGHIGFNEPDSELLLGTHLTALKETTIAANARFFASEADVPRHALTMGLGSIFAAKKIVVLLTGNGKKGVYEKLLEGKVSTECPATLLHLHPDCTVFVDDSIL